MRLARERAASGDTVIVVLHDLNVAAAYADRVTLLQRRTRRRQRWTARGCRPPSASAPSTARRSRCSSIHARARR